MTDLSQNWVDALRAAHDHGVPPTLADRVRAELAPTTTVHSLAPARRRRRYPLAMRGAALVLGVHFFNHGVGSLFFGEWIADQTHGHYDAHASREAALALLGLGVLTILASFRARLLRAASIAAVPVGLAYGVMGASEISTTAWGFALHAGEALSALILGWFWWRYARGPDPEDEA